MKKIIVGLAVFASGFVFSQNMGTVTGNVESTFKYLQEDPSIGALVPEQKAAINSFALINYSLGKFRAGIRIESYLPSLPGYPDRFDGTGLGYRYAGWYGDKLEVTLGNFYGQFGSGMLFRAYEQPGIGIDNAMDGIKLVYKPYKGIQLKGVYGRQRFAMSSGRIIKGEGVVRGFDGEVDFTQMFPKMAEKKLAFSIGGSFVSKYQPGTHPDYILPKNVGSYGGRARFGYENFFIDAEYVIKENDPSLDNGYIYNKGHGMVINTGYSMKGLGILFSMKSVDNMSFRSERERALTDLNINFLPALATMHSHNLAATLYPYTTQPLGEVALQADVIYTVPKKSKLGGKYGMKIKANFAMAYAPIQSMTGIDPNDSSRITYKGKLFDKSNRKYFQDFNINIQKKFNKHFKLGVTYYNLQLNNDVVEVTTKAKGIIISHIAVVDLLYKINYKHSLRMELQTLFTEKKKDQGHWFTGVLEYTASPNWFASAQVQWNFGNPEGLKKGSVFPIFSVGYIHHSSRFTVSYGRNRAGLFCVGGVCRTVPAGSGLTFSFTHSF